MHSILGGLSFRNLENYDGSEVLGLHPLIKGLLRLFESESPLTGDS